MLAYRVVAGCWLVFFAYWAVSAGRAKPSVHPYATGSAVGLRVAVAVVILLLVRARRAAHLPAPIGPSFGHVPGGVELTLVVLGLAFAVWARVHLGRNWGMPMSLRQEPELVASGPYAYVRHPIYSGMLLALLGSALRGGILWPALFVVCCAYFIYSATREERDMRREFPHQYPEYAKRTKMLIPFVL